MSGAVLESPPVPAATPAEQQRLVELIRGSGVTVTHMVGHSTYGDAVSNDALHKWRALRALGIPGDFFSGVRDGHYVRLARPIEGHCPVANELVVFHYAVWSQAAEHVLELGTPVVLAF